LAIVMNCGKNVLKWQAVREGARLLAAFLLVSPVLLGVCLPAYQAWAEKLVVLHTNDHHGHPVAFPFEGEQAAGGLPARATLVERIRAENENVLILDAGDINTGRPESNLFNARPDIIGYNFIGYDAMALGNHDFDHGKQVLAEQRVLADFPFLSANILTSSGKHLVQPYVIKHFKDFDVAVFGLTTVDTVAITYPESTAGLRFEDEVKTARKLVPLLREQADVVIALVHLGLYGSRNRGSVRLAREVPGIDLVVDGHTHTRIEEPVRVKNLASGRLVPVVQAWKWGLAVGRVDMDVTPKGSTVSAFELLGVNLPKEVSRLPKNEHLSQVLAPFRQKTDEMLSEPIAAVTSEITRRNGRIEETPLGRLVSESMLWAARMLKPDFAVQNSGGIRDDISEGTLTPKTIYQVLPFDNTVVVVELDGNDMARLLKHMAVGAARDEKGFPQVSAGLDMTVEAGSGRIIKALIGGKQLESDRTYRVATNSYLATGGDGYRVLAASREAHDTSICQREALIDYIRHSGPSLSPPQAMPAITALR
jgi:5'-nucleotidase / UDP-sugar diphosphatase